MTHSIVRKFSLGSVILLLVYSSILVWLFYVKTTGILVDEALNDVSIDVQEAGEQIQQVVKGLKEDILFLANTRAADGIVKTHSTKETDLNNHSYEQSVDDLEAIFEQLLEKKTKYYRIRYIDQNGEELISVFRDETGIIRARGQQLQNKADRTYVKETLKLMAGQTYLSDINLNREFGMITVPYLEVIRISTSIYNNKNNRIAGLMVITFDIGKELREIQQRASKRMDGVIYITNEAGDYLLHPDHKKTYGFDLEQRYCIQDDIPQVSPLFSDNNSKQHTTLMPEKTGINDVVNVSKIYLSHSNSKRFITLIVTQNYQTIIAEAYSLLNNISLWILLVAIVAVALAIIFSVSIARPIQQITKIVNDFSFNGSSQSSLPIELKDEIGVLARAFNTMIVQVNQSQEKLKDLNINLESIVYSRTKDLNQARIEAEQANRSKSKFLSSMSHELRTPLNAILGFAQLLQLGNDDLNEDQKEDIHEIIEAGQHLLKLINEVLDLSRIEAGKVEITLQEIDVKNEIQQCLSLVHPIAKSYNITQIFDLTEANTKIQADKMRFKQVIVNLLSNAIKYNRPNGSITISTQIIGNCRLRIQITDTGNGLTAEEINRLFIPFERLNKENIIEGAGIGLVITKNLTELMGGAIGVDSTPTEGCTFWIEMPIDDYSKKSI